MMRQRSLLRMIPHSPPTAAIRAASSIACVFYKGKGKGMIEGPCSGKADAAIAEDVVALTATVAGNTADIGTKADGSALTTAESTISTHTGELNALTATVGGIPALSLLRRSLRT